LLGDAAAFFASPVPTPPPSIDILFAIQIDIVKDLTSPSPFSLISQILAYVPFPRT